MKNRTTLLPNDALSEGTLRRVTRPAYRHSIFFLLVTIMLGNFSCNGQRSKEVFDEYLKKISSEEIVAKLKKDFEDTLDSWLVKRLDRVLFLTKTEWKIDDAVFLNKAKTRALLLVLVKVDNPGWPVDYVKVIGAEKLGGSWQFYYASFLVMEFSRHDNNDKPCSFEVLAQQGRKNICVDGFVTCGISCKINYDYIDSDIWFPDWVRQMHRRFLTNELPKNPLDKDHEVMY